MASSKRVIKKLENLYRDIDHEIETMPNSPQRIFRKGCKNIQNSLLQNHVKGRDKFESILKTTKKISKDVNKTDDKKISKNKKNNSSKVQTLIPPIWDTNKLNSYMHNILSELEFNEKDMIDYNCKDKEMDDIKKRGNCLKSTFECPSFGKDKYVLRNVGTNVKFLLSETNYSSCKNNLNAERRNKKSLTSNSNDLKIGVNIENEKSFPKRVARVLNTEQSVNVDFKKHFKFFNETSKKHKLTFSTMTFTSTSDLKKSIKSENVQNIEDSNLVTNRAQQMSKVFLPVISIKANCQVQEIYNFEISPFPKEKGYDKDDTIKNQNVKFIAINKQENPKNVISLKLDPDVTEKSNTFRNVNEPKNTERFHNIGIGEEKKKKITEIFKNSKKLRDRRVKKRTCSKIISFKDFRRNIRKESQKHYHLTKNDKGAAKGEESSSSFSDNDRKLSNIFKIYDKNNQTKIGSCNEDKKTFSSAQEEYQDNPSLLNDMKKTNDIEYKVITESFQSIYRLIEDTFQPNPSQTESRTDEGENDFSEIKEIIKLSEENIRKAEFLLKKYNLPKTNQNCLISKDQVKKKVNVPVNFQEPNLLVIDNITENISILDEKGLHKFEEDATNEILYPKYKEYTQKLVADENLTSETGVQTTSDKSLQTEENFHSKSKTYFKPIYDNFKNINFDKINFRQLCFSNFGYFPNGSGNNFVYLKF